MDDFRLLLGCFMECFAQLVLPGKGHHIEHILSEEQKIVSQGHQRKEVIGGKGRLEQANKNDRQIKQGKNPGADGDDEEQQKLRLGV